jgi:hypothetical protein
MALSIVIPAWAILWSPVMIVALICFIVGLIGVVTSEGGGDAAMIGAMFAIFGSTGVALVFGLVYWLGVFMGHHYA